MTRSSTALVSAAVICSAVLLRSQTASVPPPRAILDTYCVTCHNQRLKTAGLVLEKDKVDLDNIGADPALWEKVAQKMRSQAMPPAGVRRPGKTEYSAFTLSLETALDRAAAG